MATIGGPAMRSASVPGAAPAWRASPVAGRIRPAQADSGAGPAQADSRAGPALAVSGAGPAQSGGSGRSSHSGTPAQAPAPPGVATPAVISRSRPVAGGA